MVVVTDKNAQLIPNCDVTVGENYSINVTLPTGTPFNNDNRITVTVVTEKGEPVNGLRVQLIGDGDFVENGYTNIRGQVTLPMSNSDYTDNNGNAEVGDIDGDKIYDYIVTVSDEKGFIPNALVTLLSEDTSILVCLPEGKTIGFLLQSYHCQGGSFRRNSRGGLERYLFTTRTEAVCVQRLQTRTA